MIEVAATIEFPGAVHMIGPTEDVPHDQVCIQSEGRVLFVEGARRGHSALIDRTDSDYVYEEGQEGPRELIVTSTRVQCILELGERT